MARDPDLEHRKRTLQLAVMSRLQNAKYGYSLRVELSRNGLDIDEGTLYPLLRRMEQKGILVSEWRVEDGRSRRYYKNSAEGNALYSQMSRQWLDLVKVMGKLLDNQASRQDSGAENE